MFVVKDPVLYPALLLTLLEIQLGGRLTGLFLLSHCTCCDPQYCRLFQVEKGTSESQLHLCCDSDLPVVTDPGR